MRGYRTLSAVLRQGGWSLILVSAVSRGESTAQSAPLEEPSSEVVRSGLIDRTHASVSGGVEAFVSRVDALFAGAESYDAPTGSYLRVGGNYTLRESRYGGSAFAGIVRAKVRLPQTNNRLQLMIDQGLERVTQSQSQTEAERATGQITTDDTLFVGLRAVAAEKSNIQLTSDAGLRLRGIRPDPFVRGRALRAFEAGAWNIPLSETLLWRSSDGFSAATELSFIREVAASTVLSITSNVTYRFDAHRYDLSQVFTLAKRLDDRSLLAGEAGAFGHTEPRSEVISYTFAVRYRQKLRYDWVLMEIRPQLTFPRDRGFRTVPSLTFGLEAYFGKGKLPEP